MRLMRRVTPALVLGVTALLVTPVAAQAAPGHGGGDARTDSFGTKAVYQPEQNSRSYQKVPAGFTPVFTENVSRHGSRSATDSSDGDLILALLDKAQAENQLTPKGREFGPKAKALEAAMSTIGYGNLSARGKEELHDTAVRMAKRLPTLFASIAKKKEPIDVVSSGQGRAIDSANALYGARRRPHPDRPRPDLPDRHDPYRQGPPLLPQGRRGRRVPRLHRQRPAARHHPEDPHRPAEDAPRRP